MRSQRDGVVTRKTLAKPHGEGGERGAFQRGVFRSVCRAAVSGILGLLIGSCGLLFGQDSTETHRDAPPAAWPVGFREDANLLDVFFLDDRLGWAVGERGTVLHTRDGGRSWQHQETGVGCRLESIHFADPQHGWIVGGWTIPYTHRSRAVLLRTQDGGASWERMSNHFLPWLKQITFRDRRHGLAIGDSNAISPSGVFRTDDGGKHWSALRGSSSGWVDAVLPQNGPGMLLQEDGQLASLDGDRILATRSLEQEDRLPQRIHYLGAERWLLVGNQGLLLLSDDDGRTWQAPHGLPAPELLVEFDWLAVDAVDERICMVGAPGARVLVSADGGQTWQLEPTNHTVPLYDVAFRDAQTGWAVGALGSILKTQDGGRSWVEQRGQNARLAVLSVIGQTEAIPWEALAQLAAAEGHYLGLEVLTASPALRNQPGQTPAATRLHEAVTALGGVGANLLQAIPSADPRLALPEEPLQAIWDERVGGDSVGQVAEYLARQIRIWRPHLVLTSGHATEASDGLSRLTRRVVMQAIEQAADATCYPNQQRAGLAPWRVPRVSGIDTTATHAGYTVTSSRAILGLGKTVGQLASRSRGRLQEVPEEGPATTIIRMSESDGVGGRHLFAPVTSSSSRGERSSTRRPSVVMSENYAHQHRSAQQRKTLEAILAGTDWEQPALWQQAMHLAAELDAADRAEMFWGGAARALRAGQSTLALELLRQLQEAPDTQAYAEPAEVRMLHVLAAEEALLHWPRPETPTAADVSMNRAAAWQPLEATASGGVSQVSFLQPSGASSANLGHNVPQLPMPSPQSARDANRGEDSEARSAAAVRLFESIQQSRPDLYFESFLRLPFASLQRRMRQPQEAAKLWQSALSGRTSPALRSWAAAELAMQKQESTLPRRVWPCLRVDQPPRLDGDFQDPMWAELPVVKLEAPRTRVAPWPDQSETTTELRLAYDQDYLYLAARCQKAQAFAYPAVSGPTRERDLPMIGDRLEWYLDVDRDAVTHWALAVDARGWARDALLDDLSWNPRWYIAAKQTESTWTVEAAIPLEELSASRPGPGDAWCLGMQRIIPGLAWQTWLQTPPVEQNPAEYGLLVFGE